MNKSKSLEEVYQTIMKVSQSSKIINMPKVFGIPGSFNFQNVYVETKLLDSSDIRRSLPPSGSVEVMSAGRILGLDAIKINKKIIVRGKPGSGKTIFLKHIYYSPEVFYTLNHIPIIVSLHDYSLQSTQNSSKGLIPNLSLAKYIDTQMLGYGIESTITHDILMEGKAICLFDGLDEMASSDIRDVIGFIRKYNQNRFVISGRNASNPFIVEDFVEVQISDFDHNQAKEFVTKFFDEHRSKYDPDLAMPENATRMISQLGEKANIIVNGIKINKFTQTPLLLWLLCFVLTIKEKPPSSRLELYDQAVNLFLSDWDEQRDIKRRSPSDFPTEKTKDFLSKIAIQAHSERLTTISRDFVYSTFAPEYHCRQFLDEILRYIEESSGLLIASPINRKDYEFRHKTFQEYFAAVYITDSLHESCLASQVHYERIVEHHWLEVFSLVAESLSKSENTSTLIFRYLRRVIESIQLVLTNDKDLDQFIQDIDRQVNEFFFHRERYSGPENLLKAALRVFLFDPDYRHDATRSLLLELDQSFGNILVASSFIIRLFCDEKEEDIEILEAIETVMSETEVKQAIDADHSLEIIYRYAKDNSYKIIRGPNRNEGQKGYFKLRNPSIRHKLESIYNNGYISLVDKGQKCRELCYEHLQLQRKYHLDQEQTNTYSQLYISMLLLTRILNSSKERLLECGFRHDYETIIMSSRDYLDKVSVDLSSHL